MSDGARWPAATHERRPWHQSVRGGTREDRTLDHVDVLLPAHIAHVDAELKSAQVQACVSAEQEIAALDASASGVLESLSLLLLRTESVASSKIEHVDASTRDYARALHGVRSDASATSMVAAGSALQSMMLSVSFGSAITLAQLLRAHELLMADDPSERMHAGKLRTVQNWVGGSDHSPRHALLVPPPPESVPAYMDDLLTFCNRDDMPALAQAALAHAQFESIHPFTDGNGRIGRALINLVLRRRGATRHVVIPLASALVAQRDQYFAHLDAYRGGEIDGIVEQVVAGAEAATREAKVSAERLRDLPAQWRQLLQASRSDSAAVRVLSWLAANPIIVAEDLVRQLGIAQSRTYVAIEQLVQAGILAPLTDRKRDQIWGAVDVLDELDDLAARIGRAAYGGGL